MKSPKRQQQDSNGPSTEALMKILFTEDKITRCGIWLQHAEELSTCWNCDERPPGSNPDARTGAQMLANLNESSSANSIARHEHQLFCAQVRISCKAPMRTKRRTVPCA